MDRISQDACTDRMDFRPAMASRRFVEAGDSLDLSALIARINGAAHAAAAIHLGEIANAPMDHDGLGGLP